MKILQNLIIFEVIMILSFVCVPAIAEEKYDPMSEISLGGLIGEFTQMVSIATGVEQSTAKAPSVASVITAKDIEVTGATSLDEILETVPGLHVARSNFLYNPIYSIRGIYANWNPQVLMLINGTPIKELYLGNRHTIWGDMPVNNIARIEVIRGPGSAVFGADAFSGVINVITKTKNDIRGTEVGSRVGSFETGEAWLLHGNSWNGFDIALSLEYRTTDGHKEQIDADTQTQFDKRFGTNASFAPGPVNLSQRGIDARMDVSQGMWRMRMGYQGRRDVETGAGLVRALDPNGRHTADRTNIDLIYHNPDFTRYWDVTAQISYLNMVFDTTSVDLLFPPGAFGYAYPTGYKSDTDVSENHTHFNISGFYSGIENHLVRIGVGYYIGDLYELRQSKNYGINPVTGKPLAPRNELVNISDTPYAIVPEEIRKNWSAFLQDTWTLTSNWELTTGLRYDNYSDFGSTINPRAALVWQLSDSLTSKFLYGRAFRTPAFIEFYAVNSAAVQGNLNLEPETIDTWELAFDYQATKTLHFALNFFNYKWQDAIRYMPDQQGNPKKAQNVGNQTGRGLEFEARWKMAAKLSLLANYAFLQTSDELDNDTANAPQHQIYLRTDWLLNPNWFLNTQVNWIGERNRVVTDSRPPLDGYTTVDLTLRQKNLKEGRWNFALSVRNLFDADAREPSEISIPNDLPLAGRNYWLELRYNF
ncbi:TonB-dependent receptor [Candidatus Halobeggiatoa sp. HSG11]|nr:TonB-dependent receptor [Candidatus Halobeggiatoa sp. HSG11]